MGRKVIPGDIIFCDRGFYSHFGIYVGELNVIHFDSNFIDKVTGYKDPRIAKTDVEKFRCEDKIYTIPPQELLSVIDDYCSFEDGKYNFYSPEETVKRAYGRLNAPKKENYSLLGNNCEHFAIWCKTGIHDSRQARNYNRFSSHPITLIFGLVGLGLSAINKELFQEEAEF